MEIAVVSLAILVLLAATAQAGRRGLGLFRVMRRSRGLTQPHVERLTGGTDAAQRRVFAISERMTQLQERTLLLGSTARKLMVLIKALREARERFAPALRYLGR